MKCKYRLKFVISLVIFITFSIFCSYSGFAQEGEVIKLQNKISELEGRIKLLESLLKGTKKDANEQIKNEFGWQNKKNWRNLSIGMSESEVQKLLGDPAKSIEGVRTLWYYPNIYCGYVSFGEDGLLIGWNEP